MTSTSNSLLKWPNSREGVSSALCNRVVLFFLDLSWLVLIVIDQFVSAAFSRSSRPLFDRTYFLSKYVSLFFGASSWLPVDVVWQLSPKSVTPDFGDVPWSLISHFNSLYVCWLAPSCSDYLVFLCISLSTPFLIFFLLIYGLLLWISTNFTKPSSLLSFLLFVAFCCCSSLF